MIEGEYGFWLYSAMTQATAALFGVIGMFIVYKLQSLRNSIKESERGVLHILQIIGLSYVALERAPFYEAEKMLDKEIAECEFVMKMSDKEALDKNRNKKEEEQKLNLLRPRKQVLNIARENHNTLIKKGKASMVALGFIFIFSIALLISKPLLERISFISLTGIYIVSFIIVAIDIWHLMKEALTL